MKFKTNIPALLIAALIFVASNGVVIFEHICNVTQTHNISLFSKSVCDMEKPYAPCCAKRGIIMKKGCCDHKQFFSKLAVEGFVSDQLLLKSHTFIKLDNWNSDLAVLLNTGHAINFSGIPPPDNLYLIKYLLRPTPSGLQIFRC